MELHIIAGPNGVGKTTFARTFPPKYADCTNFINADLIAQGMSPFSPEAGVGVFPEDEEILISGLRFGGIAGYGASTSKTEVGPISVCGTPKPKLGSSIHAKNFRRFRNSRSSSCCC
jgi:hypothetical protein